MAPIRALAARIGRHSIVYMFGVVLAVVIGAAALAVFTRLLEPRELGELAVVVVIAGLLRRVYTLAIIQGTIGLMFGGGGDEDGDLDGPESESTGNPREALGTGFLLAVLVAWAGTVVLLALAPQIAAWLFESAPDPAGVRLAVLAVVAGALSGPTRLLLIVPRFERRPWVYVALSTLEPLLAVGVGAVLVARGEGVQGAALGVVLAAAGVFALSLLALRKTYRICFHGGRALRILRLGGPMVPVLLALFIMSQGGIIVLAQSSLSRADIGLYAVALGFGYLILRASSILFMAFMPLKRTSLFVAVHKRRGHGWIYGTLASYFLLGLCSMLVLLTAAAGSLIKVAGAQYAAAESSITVLGCAAVAHSMFLLSYRISSFPRKRPALALAAIVAGTIFVGAGVVLVEEIGVHGVPLAAIAGFVVAGSMMVGLNQRGPNPIPFQYGRIARLVLTTTLCVGGHQLLAPAAGELRALLDSGAVALFCLLVLGLRIVSPGQLRLLAAVVGDSARIRRRGGDSSLRTRIAALTPAQAETLARATEDSDDDATAPSPAALVGALRLASGAGDPSKRDAAIGTYLMSDRSRAERDAMARALWKRGVPPEELDALEGAFESCKRLPRDAWQRRESTTA